MNRGAGTIIGGLHIQSDSFLRYSGAFQKR